MNYKNEDIYRDVINLVMTGGYVWEIAKAADLIGFTITGAYRHYIEARSLPVDVDDITEAVASSTIILSSIISNKILRDINRMQSTNINIKPVRYFKIYLDDLKSEFHINAIKKLSASINDIMVSLFNNILNKINDNNVTVNNYFNIVDRWMKQLIMTSNEEQIKQKLSTILYYIKDKSLIFKILYNKMNDIEQLLLSPLSRQEFINKKLNNENEIIRSVELAIYDIGILSYKQQISYKTYQLIIETPQWKPNDVVEEDELELVPILVGPTRLLQLYPKLKIQSVSAKTENRKIVI